MDEQCALYLANAILSGLSLIQLSLGFQNIFIYFILLIARNELESNGANAIVEALVSTSSPIEYLNLQSCKIEHLPAIPKLIEKQTLKELILGNFYLFL